MENNHFILNTQDVFLPYDEKDFYLNEDLLDKQVIDIDGKRLVRVNDVLLENNGGINVIGIDIGTGGIIRRLGLGQFIHLKSKTLPWGLIEAFDYNTGAIRISLTQNRLNKFHSSEIADIIEQAGIKERLGIVGVLDVKKAARAIEELNNETQVSILQQISTNLFKNIIGKMLLSEIADVFYRLNPLRVTQILNELGQEKTTKIEKLSKFSNNVAGGIMDTLYYQINSDLTIK
ncbi:MAG: hypothetical protein M1365_02040, partial [Actinobacteria bacterium]|nr:hypothetical protein [Actinomycetota bacterium]